MPQSIAWLDLLWRWNIAKFALIGASYTSQSVNADCQSTINLYPEVIESGAGNSQIVLYPSPGLKSFVDLTPIVPPPPEFLDSQIVSATAYHEPLGGTFSGLNWLNVPLPTTAISVGDTVFLSFDAAIELGHPYNPILTLQCPGLVAGNMTQIGITLDQGVTNVSHRFFQVFYGKAINPVSAGALTFNATFATPPFSGVPDALFVISLVQMRNLNAQTQENHGVTTASPASNPSLTLTEKSFYGSFIGPAESTVSVNKPPFFVRVGNHFAAGYHTDMSLGDVFDLPAGTYQPLWTQAGGPFNVAIINCVFSLDTV
jgi:hypothetical protein